MLITRKLLARSLMLAPTPTSLSLNTIWLCSIISPILCAGKLFIAAHLLCWPVSFSKQRNASLYGKPGAYGVVTMPFGVREGINVFLAGFVPTENLRFRDESLTFKVAERAGTFSFFFAGFDLVPIFFFLDLILAPIKFVLTFGSQINTK